MTEENKNESKRFISFLIILGINFIIAFAYSVYPKLQILPQFLMLILQAFLNFAIGLGNKSIPGKSSEDYYLSAQILLIIGLGVCFSPK
jgi:hypothetical protein